MKKRLIQNEQILKVEIYRLLAIDHQSLPFSQDDHCFDRDTKAKRHYSKHKYKCRKVHLQKNYTINLLFDIETGLQMESSRFQMESYL